MRIVLLPDSYDAVRCALRASLLAMVVLRGRRALSVYKVLKTGGAVAFTPVFLFLRLSHGRRTVPAFFVYLFALACAARSMRAKRLRRIYF